MMLKFFYLLLIITRFMENIQFSSIPALWHLKILKIYKFRRQRRCLCPPCLFLMRVLIPAASPLRLLRLQTPPPLWLILFMKGIIHFLLLLPTFHTQRKLSVYIPEPLYELYTFQVPPLIFLLNTTIMEIHFFCIGFYENAYVLTQMLHNNHKTSLYLCTVHFQNVSV